MPLASPADRVQAYLGDLAGTWDSLRQEKNPVRNVHRARVLTRRLDAVFRIKAALLDDKSYRRLKKANRKLRKRLSKTRELDIHIRHWKELAKSETYSQEVLRVMKKQRRKYLSAFLKRRQFERFLGAAERIKREGVSELRFDHDEMASSLQTHLRNIYSCDQFYKDTLENDYIHQERLAAKKLRYDLEEVQLLIGANFQDEIAMLKEIQDELGSINDLEVFYNYLVTIRNLKRRKLSSATRKNLKRIAVHIESVRELCLRDWERHWSDRKKNLTAIEKLFERLKAA